MSDTVLTDALIHNTTTSLMPYRVCHCHRWRFDECPNTGVATLIAALVTPSGPDTPRGESGGRT